MGKYAPKAGADAVRRAVDRLGTRGYNLVVNNCEHFVNECRYGTHGAHSHQVRTAVAMPAWMVYRALQNCTTLVNAVAWDALHALTMNRNAAHQSVTDCDSVFGKI